MDILVTVISQSRIKISLSAVGKRENIIGPQELEYSVSTDRPTSGSPIAFARKNCVLPIQLTWLAFIYGIGRT